MKTAIRKIRRSVFLAYVTATLLVMTLANRGLSDTIDVKAMAVLQRVIDTRTATPDLTVELVYEIVDEGKRAFRLHALDNMLRIDEFRSLSFDDNDRESTVLVLGNVAWGHRFDPYGDLIKTTADNIRRIGFNAFTPRQLGVSTFLALGDDFENLLIANAQSIMLKDDSSLSADGLRKVEVHRDSVLSQHSIDASTGRLIERVNFLLGKRHSRSVSEYGGQREPLWLPKAVRIEMFNSGRKENLTEIRCVTINPDAELFELKALGIPTNTPVVDYDLQRRIGHWNGAEIVPEGNVGGAIDGKPRSWVWIAGGITALVAGGIIALRLSKRRNLT